MKSLLFIGALLVFYGLGNLYPLSSFNQKNKDIILETDSLKNNVLQVCNFEKDGLNSTACCIKGKNRVVFFEKIDKSCIKRSQKIIFVQTF